MLIDRVTLEYHSVICQLIDTEEDLICYLVSKHVSQEAQFVLFHKDPYSSRRQAL